MFDRGIIPSHAPKESGFLIEIVKILLAG